jgi:hypothetical protein
MAAMLAYFSGTGAPTLEIDGRWFMPKGEDILPHMPFIAMVFSGKMHITFGSIVTVSIWPGAGQTWLVGKGL